MLRLTLPHVDAWNIWFTEFGNSPDGLRPHLDRLDRLCVESGRNPADILKTAAVLVSMGDSTGRARVPDSVEPVRGTAVGIATRLRQFHALGIDHLQLVLDPITPATIAALAPVIELLQRDDLSSTSLDTD